MTDPNTPGLEPDLRAFIETAFPSVWALETFLLLKRSAPRSWSVAELVGEMRASTTLVTDCLKCLERAGLADVGEDRVIYRPASIDIAALADRLQALHAERPFSVTGVIAARRPDPLRGFADSFRLGGWKP